MSLAAALCDGMGDFVVTQMVSDPSICLLPLLPSVNVRLDHKSGASVVLVLALRLRARIPLTLAFIIG